MKKIIVLLFVLLLAACTPVAQGFVDLPATQEAGIAVIVTALLAFVFDFAIAQVPWLEYFRQYQEAWSMALSVLAVTGLENLLPTGSEALSIPLVTFLIALLTYLLVRTALQRKGVKGFAKS